MRMSSDRCLPIHQLCSWRKSHTGKNVKGKLEERRQEGQLRGAISINLVRDGGELLIDDRFKTHFRSKIL